MYTGVGAVAKGASISPAVNDCINKNYNICSFLGWGNPAKVQDCLVQGGSRCMADPTYATRVETYLRAVAAQRAGTHGMGEYFAADGLGEYFSPMQGLGAFAMPEMTTPVALGLGAAVGGMVAWMFTRKRR